MRFGVRIEGDQACNQDCYVERPRHCFHYRKPARSPRNGRNVTVANRGQRNKAEIKAVTGWFSQIILTRSDVLNAR
jgi:hypothetical protein